MIAHLARRFLGSLSPRGIDPSDDAWVCSRLLPGERRLWRQMALPDRKHAAGVARMVDDTLDGAPRPVIAAAALHDVGKIESRLGTMARVGATVAAAVAGRGRLVARGHASPPGTSARRLADYLSHDVIGADLLTGAGSDPRTVAWAAEHHRPPERWTLPAATARALHDADDD